MVPQKNRSWQILAASQNLESVFYKSQSLVFARFGFTFIECRNFLPRSLGFRFSTRISASQRVSVLPFATPP